MLPVWLLTCVHFFNNLVDRPRICLCFICLSISFSLSLSDGLSVYPFLIVYFRSFLDTDYQKW